MKKRLRRKLSRGEFTYPYPHTHRQCEANARVGQALAAVVEALGADRFLTLIAQANEAVAPPGTFHS